ncbi:(Fe-S)-binding protein [Carboxydochorda subterranea]|uniref:(Fe-S)-binding protein n=1 Tax=Carboxydichorda subterranea TaxID=3109565 RepID=A0ABZ1BTX4_9FIRM|nr:(Fe-S)-binding protein [Limnochorda sp. L945t]WRP16101.1 (Fe-S)-binding protein [Limnochorda sp. L945t]
MRANTTRGVAEPGAETTAPPAGAPGASGAGPTQAAAGGPAGSFGGVLGALLANARDLTYQCMRCGFCLPACPTYRETLLETEGPRGRIQLVRAAAEGRIGLLEIAAHLDLCIGCRACETACPAGVQYGAILEQVRPAIEERAPRRPVERWARTLGIGVVLGHPAGIRWARWGLWLYQRSGLAALVRATGLLRRLAPAMARLEEVLPRQPAPWVRTATHRPAGGAGAPRVAASPGGGVGRRRVAFFEGCVQSAALFEVNRAAVRVLRAAGFEVVVPQGQGCCGAVHAHAGQYERALEQARRNIAVFERVDADYVVNIAGGCGAAMKEYPEWFERERAARAAAAGGHGSPANGAAADGVPAAGGDGWVERARRLAARVRDFSELLADHPLPPMGPVDATVTYQDSCHLRNVQKIVSEPRRLLQRVPGLRYVELPGADRCCGAGGIYNLTQPAMSARVLEEKMEQVRATGASILAVANTPCHLQLLVGARSSGLAREGLKVRHIAEILDEALAKGPKGG